MTPGVYFNLPERVYFAADAIGSSDLKTLLHNPADWWYSSRHNRHYQDSDTLARRLGRALHTLMLEGEAKYESQFTIEPDPADYPDAARTADDIKALLKALGHAPKSTVRKPELVEWAISEGLGSEVWDAICGEHNKRVDSGFQPLTAAQDRALRHMAGLALTHADIGSHLRSGLNEVSVFWYRGEGDSRVLCRARLDCLHARFTLDLKSMSNWQGKTPNESAKKLVTEREYDLQRVFYDEARRVLAEFVLNDPRSVFWCSGDHTGQFFTASTEQADRDLLREIASRKSWDWVWLFFQLRDDQAGKAPILVPRYHRPVGTVFDEASNDIDRAFSNFIDYRSRFGFDTPWHHVEPLEEWEDGDLANLQFKRSMIS